MDCWREGEGPGGRRTVRCGRDNEQSRLGDDSVLRTHSGKTDEAHIPRAGYRAVSNSRGKQVSTHLAVRVALLPVLNKVTPVVRLLRRRVAVRNQRTRVITKHAVRAIVRHAVRCEVHHLAARGKRPVAVRRHRKEGRRTKRQKMLRQDLAPNEAEAKQV